MRALSIALIEALRPRGRCEFVQRMPIAILLAMLPLADRPETMAIVDRIARPDVPETRRRGFDDPSRCTMAKVAARRGQGATISSTG